MNIRLNSSTKMMSFGIVLSLGWFLFEACECDETKEDQFPGFWVACIDNKPTLMTYSGDHPTVVTSDPSGNFNPSDWDCSHPNSPHYKKSEGTVPPSGTQSGPNGLLKPHATGSQTAYIPQQFRDLPFLPHMTAPATPAACDATYPDVLQTVHTNATVTRISTCPFKIKARIPVVSRPLQVDVTPDGSTAVVTSFDNAVNIINLATNTVKHTITTDPSINPNGIAISPDGALAYVTSFNTDNPVVIVIDLSTYKTVATMRTIAYPQGATLSPDGSQLWITSPLAYTVDVFDTLTNTRITGLAISQAVDVAFNSTGTRAYITSDASFPGKVYAVDTATFQTQATYVVGSGPADISMSYGDQFLVVNNDTDGSISVIDLIKNTVSTTKVGANPSGIAFVR